MFVFKKAEPAVYHSEATDAEFKFRQNSENEKNALLVYIDVQRLHYHDSLTIDWSLHQDDYYAAWLMEDFSGVQQDGKALSIIQFPLREKARLIQKLKDSDPKFSEWFASHCEKTEKKTEETASDGALVGTADMQAVHGE